MFDDQSIEEDTEEEPQEQRNRQAQAQVSSSSLQTELLSGKRRRRWICYPGQPQPCPCCHCWHCKQSSAF